MKQPGLLDPDDDMMAAAPEDIDFQVDFDRE